MEYHANNVSTNDTSVQSLVKNPSTFTPPPNRNFILDTYIDYLTKYSLEQVNISKSKTKYILKIQEWEAIMQLKNDRNLVIKEGDKGGACFIMDKNYYKEKILSLLSDKKTILSLLSDKKTYKEIHNTTIEKEMLIKIEKLTNSYRDALTKEERDYITNFDIQASNNYGLPKVHKCTEILKAIQDSPDKCLVVNCPTSLTMRPIIAGPKCTTSRLSDFIDKILRPFLCKVESYVRDDIDFLTKMPREADTKRVFATFDITSMYTNIENSLGLEAIKFWLENYPETKPRNIPDQFIINAIRIILEQNTFNFDNRTYLQIFGTAMGTKCAPVYATLVIAYLETKLYKKLEEKFGLEARKKFQQEWMRYLDDCFIYWDTRLGAVTQLYIMLNELHHNMKFTIETNDQRMNFLDIAMMVEKKKVITDINYKPTDNHNYVPFNSNHPKHTLKNIPYNLARQLCTIVDSKKTLKMRMKELQETLTHLGYPQKLIENGFKKSKAIPQEELRTAKEKSSNENLLTFVSTNNPRNPNIFPIKESISILNASPNLKNKL